MPICTSGFLPSPGSPSPHSQVLVKHSSYPTTAPFVPSTCSLITLESLPALVSLSLLGRQPWHFGINLSLFHPQSGYFSVFTEPLVIYIALCTFLDGGTINKRVSSHWVRGSVTAQVYLLCMSLHTRDLRKCLLPHPVRLNTYSNLKGALPP